MKPSATRSWSAGTWDWSFSLASKVISSKLPSILTRGRFWLGFFRREKDLKLFQLLQELIERNNLHILGVASGEFERFLLVIASWRGADDQTALNEVRLDVRDSAVILDLCDLTLELIFLVKCLVYRPGKFGRRRVDALSDGLLVEEDRLRRFDFD